MAALALVLVAVSATALALLLLRPAARPGAQVRVPNLAPGHHYSVGFVRAAFAAQGLRLRVTTPDSLGVTLSATRPPLSDRTLYVMVERGDQPPAWSVPTSDVEIGNLDIHYGGASRRVRASVEAATIALHESS